MARKIRLPRILPVLLFLGIPPLNIGAQTTSGNWNTIRSKVGTVTANASGTSTSGSGAFLPLSGGVMQGQIAFNMTDSVALDLKGKQIRGVSTIAVNRWIISAAPDYVFEPKYPLRSLEKVENFVKENHHLPDIPSAKEMQDHGIELVDMNLRLLRKIEELTLYTMQLNKNMAVQAEAVKALQAEVKALQTAIPATPGTKP